jgi:hypothetical protein
MTSKLKAKRTEWMIKNYHSIDWLDPKTWGPKSYKICEQLYSTPPDDLVLWIKRGARSKQLNGKSK